MTPRPVTGTNASLVARLRDRRSGRVIFLSHCLLNENTRYLGGACRPGCVREVVDRCLDADLGVVQLPCPEQRAWGGVLKRRLLLAYGLRERHPLLYRLRRLLLPAALFYTALVYRRLARQVAGEVADYVASGFSVAGLVGIDGSPTCGVRTTIDVAALDALAALPVRAITTETQQAVLARSTRPGNGLFIAQLRRELRRRGVRIPLLAHDLFAERQGQASDLRVCPIAPRDGALSPRPPAARAGAR
jgi:hypothetical protein